MVCDKIVFWASACRGAPKHSTKTCSGGQKSPKYSQNRAPNYGSQQNRLPGISVTKYTETVLENMLRRSENPQVQSKPSYKLWFATISSPGHQHVEVHRNTPQKRAQQVKTAPWFTQIRFTDYGLGPNYLTWASTCRCVTKQSPKTCLAGRKTSRYSENLATNYGS